MFLCGIVIEKSDVKDGDLKGEIVKNVMLCIRNRKCQKMRNIIRNIFSRRIWWCRSCSCVVVGCGVVDVFK